MTVLLYCRPWRSKRSCGKPPVDQSQFVIGDDYGARRFRGHDKTHHSNYGSYELAKCIVEGIRRNHLPIAKFLVDLPRFDPAHPDSFERFDVPAEPNGSAIKPYGN
jgi:hypothetical protein